jgi:mRNA-degrading endonuclease RelE of RelBE toxin-antitoxin system
MKYRVALAPEARDDFESLPARTRAEVRDGIDRHLRHQPEQVSRSRIRRLRGTRRPQYRLRIGDVRVFYDVRRDEVEVLGIVEKAQAAAWLRRVGG